MKCNFKAVRQMSFLYSTFLRYIFRVREMKGDSMHTDILPLLLTILSEISNRLGK